MEELTISTWLWGSKYDHHDVAKLYNGLKRNLKQPFRFVLFSHSALPAYYAGIERYAIWDYELTYTQGCFVRLRMFDPEFQKFCGITGRFVCIDLDTVITANLDPIFDRPEPFVILQGANAINPCPYTGALMMVRTGAYPQLWSDFSLDAIKEIPFYEFPDDQGWIHHKVPDAASWKAGENGVYAFQKPGWPMDQMGLFLPRDARLVTFPGARSPKKFASLDWVKRNWIE
jgi:hypothetical protein